MRGIHHHQHLDSRTTLQTHCGEFKSFAWLQRPPRLVAECLSWCLPPSSRFLKLPWNAPWQPAIADSLGRTNNTKPEPQKELRWQAEMVKQPLLILLVLCSTTDGFYLQWDPTSYKVSYDWKQRGPDSEGELCQDSESGSELRTTDFSHWKEVEQSVVYCVTG